MPSILISCSKGGPTMKITNMSKEQLEELIASGKAKLVHLYDPSNVLRPRGHMQKESIGEYILERLLVTYESWTDEKHGDNPDQTTLIKLLLTNLKEEADGAFREFMKRINTK